MPANLDPVFQHLRAGRFAEAEQVCRAGLREHGESAGLLTMFGISLHRLGRNDDALAIFRHTVGRHPEALDALGNLAALLQLAGQEAAAERCLRRLQVLQPASHLASQRLGDIRQSLGDSLGALPHIRRAVRLNPFGAVDLFNLGVLLIHLGRPAEVVDVFDTLVTVDPGHAGAYVQLGAGLLAHGRIEKAAAAYERAYRLAPDDAEARDGRIRVQRYRAAAAASRDSGRPEGILVRGPYRGLSGYAHMTDRLVAALRGGRTPVHVMGLVGSEPWADPVVAPVRGRAILNCLTPPTVEMVPGLMTVNLSMFEGTRIPLFWRGYSALHDLVIVPTRSSWTAWAERGFPEERLRLCPLGVDPEAMDGPALALTVPGGRPLSTYRHRILNVSDFIPRKNVDGVLRVWLKATTAADDAVLILKLGKGNPQTRADIQALFRQTEAVVGKRLDQAAPIVVVDATLDEAAMTALFRAATHYWSLSHGEGWDLPMSKAGALGLQLVAPAHSSYVDYLDETVARMIPCTVGPAHLPNSREPWPTFYGLDWWEPDEDAAAAIVGRIVQGRDTDVRDARRRLFDRFTWAQASDRLLAILREAGAF